MDTLGSLAGRAGCQGSILGGFWCPPQETQNLVNLMFFFWFQDGHRHHGSYVKKHLGSAVESHMRLQCGK